MKNAKLLSAMGAVVLLGALAAPTVASARTYIGNPSPAGNATCCAYPVIKPRSLTVLGPRAEFTGAFFDSLYLSKVKWSSWGGSAAQASAPWRYRTFEPW